MAATQMEVHYQENSTNVTKTSVMAQKCSPMKPNIPTFNGSKFDNIGTIKIHIHKQ